MKEIYHLNGKYVITEFYLQKNNLNILSMIFQSLESVLTFMKKIYTNDNYFLTYL